MQPATRVISDAKGWLDDKRNIAEVKERVQQAHEFLLVNHPFYGYQVLNAKVTIATFCPTACTDGTNIWFNPLFASLLSDQELVGVLAHEADHIAREHPYRRGTKDAKTYGEAGDHVINLDLLSCGFTLPKDGCFDPRFEKLGTEEVYEILFSERSKEKGQPEETSEAASEGSSKDESEDESKDESEDESKDEPKDEPKAPEEAKEDDTSGINEDGSYTLPDSNEWGMVIDATSDDGSPLNQEEIDAALDEQTLRNAEAARIEKSVGSGSGIAERITAHATKSRYDWRKQLRRHVERAMGRNRTTSWSKRSRRSVHTGGIFLPGKIREGLGEVVIAGDCSGSVGSDEFSLGLGQCEVIVNKLKPRITHWIQFDGSVKSHEKFVGGAKFKSERSGHGGTRFSPVLQKLKEEKIRPSVIIVLTDMGLWDWDSLEKPKGTEVIWCDVHGGGWGPDHVPFGEVIKVGS